MYLFCYYTLLRILRAEIFHNGANPIRINIGIAAGIYFYSLWTSSHMHVHHWITKHLGHEPAKLNTFKSLYFNLRHLSMCLSHLGRGEYAFVPECQM